MNKKLEERVKLTSSCRDCDVLDRVDNAGAIEADSDGNKYQVMYNGVKILYNTYHSPWMNDIISNLNGHHEPQEELVFHHLLETLGDNANMIELGANWTYYSIWFNKVIKNPFNICIEPIETNLQNGIDNHNLNDCENMVFLKGYMGATDEKNTQFRNWDNSMLTLDRYSLTNLITNQEFSNGDKIFDIVHSDIQGGELDVLKSSINVFHKIGYFVVSTHGTLHQPCLDILNENGFTVLVEHSIEESYAADGLIVAINNNYKFLYEKNIGMELSDYFKHKCNITKK